MSGAQVRAGTHGGAAGPDSELASTAASEPMVPFAETLASVRAQEEAERAEELRRTRASVAGLRSGSDDTVPDGEGLSGGDGLLPRRIGRFAILRRLGAGGMGTVYAGFDEELVRRVAIKVLHLVDGHSEGGRAMLRAEAQAMARLSHPNVVQIYELGVHQGQIFLVMEYVEGVTLSEWLGERERDWQVIVAKFVAAGEGLAAAHRAGIIHRDFKPDNVLLDRDGVPRVADFGLARATADGTPGQIAGTPGYMSPEQFLGQPADVRSDIFSFAVAVHRALYGASPFAGTTLDEVRQHVLDGVITAPTKPVGPPALRAALLRGVARKPEDRPGSLEELLATLRRYAPGAARQRWPLLVGVGAAVVGLAAVILWIGRAEGPSPAEVAKIAREVQVADQSANAAEWVYPADEEEGSRTAIRRIVDLEHVEGPAAELAQRQADALRGAFAADLARLGDHYWDDDRTRPFARDFYAQTLMFQPDHEHALKRGRLTAGQLADLRAQAEASTFSEDQLAAAEPLRALADVDHVDVGAVLAGLRRGCLPGQVPEATAPTPTPTPTPVEAATDTDADTDTDATDTEGAGSPSDDTEEPSEAVERPTPTRPIGTRSAGVKEELLERAKGAHREGEDGEAIRLFSQVLGLDPDNDTALGALSDLAFERGDYREASSLAERAAEVAPTVARHHLRRGDAAFKLGRKADARAAYERAIELGDTTGERRIELLEEASK
ncbi:MAG: protein kinase [Nannocystaceae bacterium]